MTEKYNDYVNRVEGHGVLNINFNKKTAKFEVSEGERLFEGLVLGRNFDEIPFIVSRICGICPTAHYISAIKAMENILNIEPTESTILLRKLMLSAQIIQSHNLHLFFLALPDYLNLKDNENLTEKYPEEFHIALNIKRMADKILEIVGGRSIHPINPVIGGFAKKISENDLANLRFNLENTLSDAEYAVDLFSQLDYPKFSSPTTYLAMTSNDYEIYHGNIKSSDDKIFSPTNYKKKLKEKILEESSAKITYFTGKSIMTGAPARLFINSDKLNLRSRAKLENSRIDYKSNNPFQNNFYQSIEIMHFFEESIKIIDKLLKKKIATNPEPFKIKSGIGASAIEAPRGTLYHSYEIDGNGKVIDADILTPTGQNLSNLESDVQKLLKDIKNLKEVDQKNQVEKLIRAYDPCLTCSVH
jgi:coenzyme F420-reducing hydrogenase alpha subunit